LMPFAFAMPSCPPNKMLQAAHSARMPACRLTRAHLSLAADKRRECRRARDVGRGIYFPCTADCGRVLV
jgi:hypothetical protein